MAKTTEKPKVITQRGGKITIDLDRLAEQATDAKEVTLSFIRRVGEDGNRVAGRVENYLRDRMARAKQEVKRKKS